MNCRITRQSDENYCSTCDRRWDIHDSAPECWNERRPRHNLIAIAGRAGSGKSTMARLIRNSVGHVEVVKFAAPVKAATRGLLIHQGFTSDEAERAIEGDLKRFRDERLAGYTPTEVMQSIGNGVREDRDLDFWVRLAAVRLKNSTAPTVIIDDLRYANEVDLVRQLGGRVVMITGRSDQAVPADHASERFEFEPDMTYWNKGTVADMERWVLAHLVR